MSVNKRFNELHKPTISNNSAASSQNDVFEIPSEHGHDEIQASMFQTSFVESMPSRGIRKLNSKQIQNQGIPSHQLRQQYLEEEELMANELQFDDEQASNISYGLHNSIARADSMMDGRTSIKKQLAQMLAKGEEFDGEDELQFMRESSRGLDKFRRSVI